MPSAILKRYHASLGKSVRSLVGRREKARCLPTLQNDAIGPLCCSRRRRVMSEIEGVTKSADTGGKKSP